MTTTAEQVRYLGIRRVLVVTLVLNLVVAAAKVVVGLAFGLLSLTADGVHSTLDGFNNIVGLVAISSASRPPDAGHPYGHRKFETFAALAISLLLGIAGVGLARATLERLRTGHVPETDPIAYVVVIGTIGVNALVTRYERRRGSELASEFLVADAQHTASDVLVSVAVLVSMIGVQLRIAAIDLICAFGIALFIGFTALRLLLGTLGTLADHVAVEVPEIERVVLAVPGVRSCHKIRTRGPAGHVFADLHIQVDPTMTVRDGHAVAHRVVEAIKRDLAGVQDVVTHLEPFEEGAR